MPNTLAPAGSVYAHIGHSVDQSTPIPAGSFALSFDTNRLLSNPAMHDATASAVALTGTVAKTSGGSSVTGTGTAFLSELTEGQKITVGTEVAIVGTINSDTSLTITTIAGGTGLWLTTASGVTATRDDTAKLKVTDSGVYLVMGLAWVANTSGTAILNIIKGTGIGANLTFLGDTTQPGTSVQARMALVTPPVQLVAGDVLWLRAFQNTGSAVAVSGIANRAPLFGYTRIG